MKKTQVIKILKLGIIATIVMIVFEAIFSIKGIENFFAKQIETASGIYVYLIIWGIMFLQCTILNIPAVAILSISFNIGLDITGIKYILIVLSAYLSGCIAAYWLGRVFGAKAIKWCAGSQEDFEKWSKFINTKGKLWYFLTILLPIFPDDMLCIVAGATRFNFWTYVWFNALGRGIGLYTMVWFLKVVGVVGGDFPMMLILWTIILIVETILIFIIKKGLTKEKK